MKNVLKKILTCVLAVVMIVSSCPIYAFADIFDSCDYEYRTIISKNGNTYVELTAYNGRKKSVTLPTKIKNKTVVGINSRFKSNVSLTNVVVPEGYDYVDGFKDFENLSITLPQSLRFISSYAFYESTVKSINFPNGLEAIGFGAFMNVNFENTDITLPDSLKYLGSFAFDDTNITSLNIGAKTSVQDIDNMCWGVDIVGDDSIKYYDNPALGKCKNLESITVDENNKYYKSENGILYSKDMTRLYKFPSAKICENFTVPKSVDTVATYAFDSTRFDSLTILPSVKRIRARAFEDATLNTVDFADECNIKLIDVYTFTGATISKLVIPSSVDTVDAYAFENATVDSISFAPDSKCKTFDDYAFLGSNIKSIVIPKSIEKINISAFSKSTVNKVTFENGSKVKVLSDGTFGNCKNLESVDFGKNNSLAIIESDVFENTKIKNLDLSGCKNLVSLQSLPSANTLESIDLSNTKIRRIPDFFFNGYEKLTDVTLSLETVEIGNSAFSRCYSLEKIDNFDNVISAQDSAFSNCYSLKLPDNIKNFASYQNTFSNCDLISDEYKKYSEPKKYGDFLYYESENSVAIYKYSVNATGDDIVVPDEINGKKVTAILKGAFYNVEAKSITLPKDLKLVSDEAFKNVIVDGGISLPDTVTYIGKSAFSGYQGDKKYSKEHGKLNTSFSLPDSIVTAENDVFYNSGLSSIDFSQNLVYIAKDAFRYSKFKSVKMPDSVIKAEYCSLNSSELEKIYFSDNLENLLKFIRASFQWYEGEKPSADKPYPKYYEVSDNNKEYACLDGVLYNKDMTELVRFPSGRGNDFTFPQGLKKIGDGAFSYSKNITSVDIPNSVDVVGSSAFYKSESLENIFIPSNVKEIGYGAFASCSLLKSVTFDDNMKLDELKGAFYDCDNLTSVTFGKNCEIGQLSAFSNCAIKNIDLSNVKTKELGGFQNNPLESITIPDGVEVISSYAFKSTELKKIAFPESTRIIDSFAFEDCYRLREINFANVRYLGMASFKNCQSLTGVDLCGVYYLDDDDRDENYKVFAGCINLKKIYFTRKETVIGEKCYADNDNLQTVVIGSLVTDIEDRAFADCQNLETAIIASDVKNISDTAFENCNNLTIVCQKSSSVETYAIKNKIPYETFTIAPIADQIYTGRAITPSLNVSQGGKKLKLNADFSVTYKDNINIGTAKAAVSGLGDYSIFASVVKFNIVAPVSPSPSKPDNNTQQSTPPKQNTPPKKPSVTTKVSKPKKTSVKKTVRGKKSLAFTVKKVSGISGYQVQTATDKKFKKSRKTITSKKTNVTFKKLKSKKKYYVRVRTYKTVKGKKYYSSWSKIKSVKTK